MSSPVQSGIASINGRSNVPPHGGRAVLVFPVIAPYRLAQGMNPPDQSRGANSTGPRQFATTQWSMVAAAGRNDTVRSQAALNRLCSIYWYPLYAFVRRQGFNAADAQDLTQSFFARLIGKQDLVAVDRAKGKFRSFLLAAMKNFLANEWDKIKTQKRGGGLQNFTSLDARTAESRYHLEPADPMTADRLYERQWALTLLDEVLKHVRDDYEEEGKGALFDALKSTLTGDKNAQPYAETAEKLGMNEGAVKVAVHRLRHRYRDALRAEIASTIGNPEEVDDELRHLFAALSG